MVASQRSPQNTAKEHIKIKHSRDEENEVDEKAAAEQEAEVEQEAEE